MNNNKDLIIRAKNFYEKRNFIDARDCLLLALRDKKINETSRLSLYILISDIYFKINDFVNSEKYLLNYIKINRQNDKVLNSLANIYLKKRDYKNSEKFYLESIKVNNNNENALVNLAILYHNLGNKEKAILYYNKILKKNSKNIGALYNLSNLDKSVLNKNNIDNLKRLIESKSLKNFDVASCYFLLAENEKRKENFNEEINLLEQANHFSFKEKEKLNIQSDDYWLNIIPKKIYQIDFSKYKDKEINTKNIYPIFIIGLPRSGSTLIESIISSGEDKIENLGETNLVNWAFLNTNREIIKSSSENEKIIINAEKTAVKLIQAIENLIINKNQEKIIFLEKSLENFYYIELLLKIYPNAKFINSNRNLIDNIFAIYKQFLSNISWSHSLENILRYFDSYIKTMDYFKKKFPDKIFSLFLENLTEKPKDTAKEIYKFCGLNWDEKCLNFHKRDDLFTNTASNDQIRRSVQKYDDKKYINYKSMLKNYDKKYNWLNLK